MAGLFFRNWSDFKQEFIKKMSFEPKQIQMICLEDLVLENHIYRKFLNLWNLDSVRLELEKLEAGSDYKYTAPH